MNKNRIEACAVGRAGQRPRSPHPSRPASCRSGGRAAKAVELTSGDLRRAVGPCENARRARLTDPQGCVIAPEKSAEGVVVRPRNQERPRASTCVGRTKARTGQEWSMRVRLDDDRATETPVLRPCRASSAGEAQGSPGKGSRRRGEARTIDPARRRAGNVDARRGRSTCRTAVYGPVRTVVWEGSGRKARPYPDPGVERPSLRGSATPGTTRFISRAGTRHPAHPTPPTARRGRAPAHASPPQPPAAGPLAN